MLKRTPLFEIHKRLGARLVEFGGWEMPVQYTSIVDEHQSVRNAAGLFDIAHMGEVLVSGPDALRFLNCVLTNDAAKLAVGQGQYTLMCNERGGVIDDLYLYRLEENLYLLIINASRIEADVAWLEKQFRQFLGGSDKGETQLKNASEEFGAVAVQGPKVAEFIDPCFPGQPSGGMAVHRPAELKKNQVTRIEWGGHPIWVSRTGYTGEDGFEIVAPAPILEAVWNQVMSAGHPHGLKPAGLGARDTLRTEACYPLYGHELDENTSPLEAGLGYFIGWEKPEFMGRSMLAEQKARGVRKKCVALKMADKSAPPRPHYPVWSVGAEQKIGEVVSGTQSPSLGLGIGLAYVPPEFAVVGTRIEIEIRAKYAPAVIVSKPIYKKPV